MIHRVVDAMVPENDPPLRILLWERSKYARSLSRYLAGTARRFRLGKSGELPIAVLKTIKGREGTLFELTARPTDLKRIADLLKGGPECDGVEVTLDCSQLPILLCVRKAEPGDPTTPYRGFLPVLDLFRTPAGRRKRRPRRLIGAAGAPALRLDGPSA
jgi:hypothetical protein